MQIGMMNDPRRNAVDEARWVAANGLDFLDLTVEGPGAALGQIDAARLKAVLDDGGLGVVGHTAWYLPFASPFARVRQAAADSVAETFELFAGLGAHWVNVHIVQGIGMFERAESLRWQGELFAQLAERAAPYGLGIMVEHPPDAAYGVSEIRGILGADERLGFHLDVGHANVGGDRLEGLLNNFGPRMAHVHLSDNRGRSDDHLPLGAGRINWPRAVSLLKRAGYDGTLTLEVFSEDRDLLLWSAERVRGWWGR